MEDYDKYLADKMEEIRASKMPTPKKRISRKDEKDILIAELFGYNRTTLRFWRSGRCGLYRMMLYEFLYEIPLDKYIEFSKREEYKFYKKDKIEKSKIV